MTVWWIDSDVETGEDERKLTMSLTALYRGHIAMLSQLDLLPSDRDLMEAIARMPDLEINEQRRHWIQQILWRYRRRLPPAVAPKANPTDPVVYEMIAAQERALV